MKLNIIIYYLTVFFTGMAVLIFEVTAVRMLSPYFGSSLYVLSSVLTIVLAALSLGYFYGGRVADRFPHYGPLYLIISGAGVVMLFLLNVSQFILPVSPELFSIVSGPLVMSLGLFFIPALLLGADSPYVIKLLTNNHSAEHNGAIVGSTFFWSTVGSIVGSLSAGFYLIPTLGLTSTIASVSVFLVLWGGSAIIILDSYGDKSLPPCPVPALKSKLLILILAMVSLVLAIPRTNYNREDIKVIYQTDGYYSRLQVNEMTIATTTYRFLKQDNNFSSAFLPGSSELIFGYSQLASLYEHIYPEAKNYLVMGGGAYSIPRSIHLTNPKIDITVFDLEPDLQAIATKYFDLPQTDQIKTVVGDARVLLRDSTETYDVIFSDVMNSGFYIPPHLSSQEFLMEMKNKLNPQGVAFINFIGVLPIVPESLTGSMIKTIASVFPNYEIVAVRGLDSPKIQNLVFILRHEDQPINFPELNIKNITSSTAYPISELLLNKKTLNLNEQVIYTDNLSKVEPFIVKQFTQQETF